MKHDIRRLFNEAEVEFADTLNENLFVTGKINEEDEVLPGDVTDRFSALANGSFHRSKLAWADTLRNVRIFNDIVDDEPTVLLDIGCGIEHRIGVFCERNELDTHYIGLDPIKDRAISVTQMNHPSRQYVGIWHDASNGIPMLDETVNYVICLEAMEHFISSRSELDSFMKDVNRVMKKGAKFILCTPNRGNENDPIQHPHCHSHEFTNEEVLDAFEKNDFYVDTYFNYRAKTSTINENIRGMLIGDSIRGFGMPDAFTYAVGLPIATENSAIPGNVLYVTRKS